MDRSVSCVAPRGVQGTPNDERRAPNSVAQIAGPVALPAAL